MLIAILELVLTRPKDWPRDWPDGYIFSVRGELLPIVFDIAGYLTGGWVEKSEDELLCFDEIHTSVVRFLLLNSEAWDLVKDKIHVGMSLNAHAGAEIIGKAKLLEYEYRES